MAVYMIVIGETGTGFSAHCPDVPGCATVGGSIAETVSNMRSALELHFEGMVEDGDTIPKPSGVKAYRAAMKDLDLDRYVLAHVEIDVSRFAMVGQR